MTNWEDASLVLPPEIVGKTFDEIGESFSGEFSEEDLREKAWDLAEMVDELSPDSTGFEIWEIIRAGIEFIRECGEDPERILVAQEEQNRTRYWWFIRHPEEVRVHPLGKNIIMGYSKEVVALGRIKARVFLENNMIETRFPNLESFLEAKQMWHADLGYRFSHSDIINLLVAERKELFSAMSDPKQDRIDWSLEVADLIHLAASLLVLDYEEDLPIETLELSRSDINKLTEIYQEGEWHHNGLGYKHPESSMLFFEPILRHSFQSRGITILNPGIEYQRIEDDGRIERELVVLHNGIFVFEREYNDVGELVIFSSINISTGVIHASSRSLFGVYRRQEIRDLKPGKALTYHGLIGAQSLYTGIPAGMLRHRVL